jgi:Secretion system C-terminal sorting domain/Reeler domain
MKKIFQTTFALIFLAALLLNFSSGPAAGGMALTGAPTDEKLGNGNARTCQACHNSGSFNPSLKIEVLNEAGSAAVTKYTAGTIYTIRLTIAASGSPSRYGFQMLDLLKSDNTNTKGFKAAGTQAPNIQVSTLSGREYVEHGEKLTSNTIDVKWKAPATNLGSVVFYAVGNAVNNNSVEGGDNGTAAVSLQLDPLVSNVNELAQNIKMELTPNPVTEGVNLILKSEKSRQLRVRVTDIAGRIVASDNWQIVAGDNQKTVDLSRVAKGAYMVQLIENQEVVTKKIFKL